MADAMKAQSDTAAEPVSAILGRWLAVPRTGDILTVVFGLLFLFLCMCLPLVGKSAAHGSGSPGAGPMDSLWKNHLFFSVTLLLTLLAGVTAMVSKIRRRRADGSAFPKCTAGLLAVCVLLSLCYAAGLLKL